MKIDIRNDLKKRTFKEVWLRDQYEKIRLAIPPEECSNEELKKVLLEEYEKRENPEGRFFNNITNDDAKITLEQFIGKFLSEKGVISGYSVLYKDQDQVKTIGSAALNNLLLTRKKFKKMMTSVERNSQEYFYYKILQLTYKLLANSYYGILGEKNSIFFNSFVQNSITMTGQDLITTSIIGMENFLANNAEFEDTEDVITFLRNVKQEEKKYDILQYVDKIITKEELLTYLKERTRKEFNEELIKEIIEKFDDSLVTRVFYKNRILDLCRNKYFTDLLKEILKYDYESDPEEGMKENFEKFKDLIIDLCYYDYLFEDRYKRSMKDKRRVITTIDTDSNFINLQRYIDEVRAITNLDDKSEKKNMTIFNIFMAIVTDVMKKLFWTQTTNLGLVDDAKPIINMKPEFVYKKLLLTRNKKNYAGIITGELGRIIEPDLDMKGLAIKKSNVCKKLRDAFKKILVDKILMPDEINISEILKAYDDLEESIEKSLKDGNTEFGLPRSISTAESYKNPAAMEQFRGAIIWNALEPEHPINLPDKANLIKLQDLKLKDDPRFEWMKQNYPEKYKIIEKVVFGPKVKKDDIDIEKFGFSCICIPSDIEKIPPYIIPYIDLETMSNLNMTNGFVLLESLGVNCLPVKTQTYKTNTIKI